MFYTARIRVSHFLHITVTLIGLGGMLEQLPTRPTLVQRQDHTDPFHRSDNHFPKLENTNVI